MTYHGNLLWLFAATLLLIGACSEDTPVGDPGLGGLDPTTYVAIGNSLTAGYQSGALFQEGQAFSFPNLLAQALGSTDFQQPLMPYPGTGELRVLETLIPAVRIGTMGQTQNLPTNPLLARPYNNLGIPGAIVWDAIDTSSILARAQQRSNPFYMFIMRDQGMFGASMIDQAAKLNPTVLTFWLGNNDVLGYATTGGTMGTNLGGGGIPPRTLPTESAVFELAIRTAFAKIKADMPNTKVLVANIPDPTATPFFTTVPRTLPNPTNPAIMMNIYYKNKEGQTGTVGENDFVLLTAQQKLQLGIGLSRDYPLPTEYVLDNAEMSIVLQAISEYNRVILEQAEVHGFVHVDMNAFLNDVKTNGYDIAGERYTTAFISGGMFSLDGIHLSARGNAVVANKFIEEMNRAYGANIRYIGLNTIPGMTAPTTIGTSKKSLWSLGLQFPVEHPNTLIGLY
ncbi:MAG: SGNH/GDSL hydrolase family protein [Bacteroidota bacterium]|jgi:hypothetical protein|nr:SGNH/GDSL hydrolase family protein [Bacteroidota bacterium]